MSEFDVTQYFNRQLEENTSKIQSLEEASRRKIEELHSKLAAPGESASPTWAEQLGLPRFGTAASVVNAAGAVATGAGRVAGHIIGAPAGLAAGATLANTPNIALDAFNREKQGIATPEESAMLDHGKESGNSYRDSIERAQSLGKATRDINKFFDISSVQDNFRQQQLSQELEASYNNNIDKIKSGQVGDTVSGLAGLLSSSAGALLNNKEGTLQFILQNMPQLAVGAVPVVGAGLMGASNVGYAVDTFHQGLENYAKKNNGALPPPQQLQEMGWKSASLAAAEQAEHVARARRAPLHAHRRQADPLPGEGDERHRHQAEERPAPADDRAQVRPQRRGDHRGQRVAAFEDGERARHLAGGHQPH